MSEPPDGFVALRIVPVQVFTGIYDCEEHDGGYGIMDAVFPWSDCNRADGHIYRVDDDWRPSRGVGDSVEILVRTEDIPWFNKKFGDNTGQPSADREGGSE